MYSRLLVPLDGSATANLALHHAAELARVSHATIVLLHIIEEMKYSNGFERPRVYVEQVRPGFLAAGQKLLDEAAQTLRQAGREVETLLVESKGQRVSVLIAQQAQSANCDVVVIGTHGRSGVDRMLMGSNAEQLARIAPVPVMLIRLPQAIVPIGAADPALPAVTNL